MPRNSSSRQTNSKVNIPKPLVPPPPNRNISTIQRNPNGGLMENIKQGFAFGTGNALSRVFVDKIFGKNNETVQPKTNMDELQKKYFECINYASSPEESEKCEMYKKHLQP